MQTKKPVVIWHYADHPARWVVAIFAVLSAVGMAGTMIYQLPSGSNVNSYQVGSDFLSQWGSVAFSIIVVVACLRQRVDGYFARSDETFEVDTGRSAPNFLAALSLFFDLVQPSLWRKTDLASLSRQCRRWFMPVRQHLEGRVDEIERIALEPCRVGVNAALYIKGKAWVVAEDLPAQEADRLRREIETAINHRKTVKAGSDHR